MIPRIRRATTIAALIAWPVQLCNAQPLPGTQPLTLQGDLAAQMVHGIDRFLMAKTTKNDGDTMMCAQKAILAVGVWSQFPRRGCLGLANGF